MWGFEGTIGINVLKFWCGVGLHIYMEEGGGGRVYMERVWASIYRI